MQCKAWIGVDEKEKLVKKWGKWNSLKIENPFYLTRKAGNRLTNQRTDKG